MAIEGEDSLFLKVQHLSNPSEVLIQANSKGWKLILRCIEVLVRDQVSGNHFHFDESSGMDGNILSLILEYKTPSSNLGSGYNATDIDASKSD